jgi:gamma-glutamyltranspeptidase/glutathione hydrolase
MKGAIAAGSIPTAEAGAEILAQGGNAVDAAVAACFAVAAGEPTITSLAGGGVMIIHAATSGETTVCDFFVDTPHLTQAEVAPADFYGIDLDYGPTTQTFYVGAAAAAVPGAIPGLCEALTRFGTLDLATVVAPACRRLRDGAVIGEKQAGLARFLEPILTRLEAPRRVFTAAGRFPRAGDVFRLPALADTLEAMAATGWRAHYDTVLIPAMVRHFGPEAGGLLTPEAFESYAVAFRRPLFTQYRENMVCSMPPPAAGGPMITLMLRLLATERLSRHRPGTAAHARRLCAAMATADEARGAGIAALEAPSFSRWVDRYRGRVSGELDPGPAPPGGPASTTHISVIDAQGNAVAVTFSHGESNAHLIGETGIMMNNMMGEEDLHPDGFDATPRGGRLPTMMSPSLMRRPDGGLTVMGTGGANRIRTAILQVVTLLADYDLAPEAAVAHARIHFEGGVLNAEVFGREDGGAALAPLGSAGFVRFDTPNLFFGGVNLVHMDGRGALVGVGDVRRGGVCRVA